MLEIVDPRSGAVYQHQCIRCGECCRHAYMIEIKTSDVQRWQRDRRLDITEGLQLDLKSVAPAAFIPLSWYTSHPIDTNQGTMEPGSPEQAFLATHAVEFSSLKGFILKNHVNKGTGMIHVDKFIPHWFLPDVDFRAIMQPYDLDVVQHGIELGFRYVTIMDLTGSCFFLHERDCTINNTKPKDCLEYPVKSQLENDFKALDKALRTCKGFVTRC